MGGGPVGLSLALDLGLRGIDTLLVERNSREGEQPRMDMVGVRTMEFARRWGIVQEVEAAGFPRDTPQDIAWSESIFGREFVRDAKPGMADEPTPVFSPQKRERCPQNFFDPVLRRAAERQASVHLVFDAQAISLREGEHAVCADVVVGGKTRSLAADYLVGCDGAGGIVRRSLGIGLDGPSALTHSLNVVFHCPAIRTRLGGSPAYRYVLIGHEGLWATIVNIDGRDDWRLQVLGGATPTDWTSERIHTLIYRAIGEPLPYSLVSVAPWTRRETVATSFRSGRCFLAGDSAHQMSPTGGYGMNSGIADAINLSWKLTAMLQGWGGAGLLDTYDLERRPVTAWTAAIASENLQRMRDTPSSNGDDAALEAAAKFAHVSMQAEYRSIGVHMGYCYDHSPIVCAEPPLQTPPIASYQQSTTPGCRAPHAWLEQGMSTLDMFGEGMTLIDLSAKGAGDLLASAAAKRAVPLKWLRTDSPAIRKEYARDLTLVRPDGHVAWRGDFPPPDAIGLIDRIRGA